MFDDKAPVGSIVDSEGPFGFTVVGNNIHDIGGSLTQRPLNKKVKLFENCSRTDVIAATTDGEKLIVNVPRCPIRFQRLSWREIKPKY